MPIRTRALQFEHFQSAQTRSHTYRDVTVSLKRLFRGLVTQRARTEERG